MKGADESHAGSVAEDVKNEERHNCGSYSATLKHFIFFLRQADVVSTHRLSLSLSLSLSLIATFF